MTPGTTSIQLVLFLPLSLLTIIAIALAHDIINNLCDRAQRRLRPDLWQDKQLVPIRVKWNRR